MLNNMVLNPVNHGVQKKSKICESTVMTLKDIPTGIQMMIIKMKDPNHENIRLGGETIYDQDYHERRGYYMEYPDVTPRDDDHKEGSYTQEDHTRRKSRDSSYTRLQNLAKTLIITRIVIIIISVNITMLLDNKYIKSKIRL